MNEEYLQLLFSAYGDEVGDDYDAFSSAMQNEDYQKMLFNAHKGDVGGDWLEFQKAIGTYEEPDELKGLREAMDPSSFIMQDQQDLDNAEMSMPNEEVVESEEVEEESPVVSGSNMSYDNFLNTSEEELVPQLREQYYGIKNSNGEPRFEFDEDQPGSDQVQVYDTEKEEYNYIRLATDFNLDKYRGSFTTDEGFNDWSAKQNQDAYNKLMGIVNVAEEETTFSYDENGELVENIKEFESLNVDESGNIIRENIPESQSSRSGMANPVFVKTTNEQGKEVTVEAKQPLVERGLEKMQTGEYTSLENAIDAIIKEDQDVAGQIRFQATLLGQENETKKKVSKAVDDVVTNPEMNINPFDGLLLKSIGEATGGMVDASEAQFRSQYWGLIEPMIGKDNLIDDFYSLGLPKYKNEESYQKSKKEYEQLMAGELPPMSQEQQNFIKDQFANSASERMNTLKSDLNNWMNNDPVGIELKDKLSERETAIVKKNQAVPYIKESRNILGGDAPISQVNLLASALQEEALNTEALDIWNDNAYGESVSDKDKKIISDLSTSFQSRQQELQNNRMLSIEKSIKEGKTIDEARVIAKQEYPVTKEDEILQNEFQSTVQNLINDDKVNIYKDVEGNYTNSSFSNGTIEDRKDPNYLKKQVDQYRFSSNDFLNRRMYENNAELIYLANQLSKRNAEWIFDGSLAQMFYNSFGNMFGSDEATDADKARIDEIVKTGKLPLKLTTIPNSDSPLVKAWNDAVEDRAVLGLAKNLNLDLTSTERDGFWGSAYFSYSPAFDMENISPNEARRRFYEEMEADGIILTKEEKFQMNEQIDGWERSGGQVGDLSRMGLEMAGTFLLTGGAGNVGNFTRWMATRAFNVAKYAGMGTKTASALTNYTAAVGAEFYALEGASFMDEQVFDKEGMSAGHNLRLAMTLGAGRAGVRQTGQMMDKAIFTVAKNQYRQGNKGLWNTLKWMDKTPGIESVGGAFKFGFTEPMTAAGLLQIEGGIENAIDGKSMAGIFHDLTDGEQLFETYGAMLVMQMSHPSKVIKSSVETFRREVDRINGDNPMWNSAYREIGLEGKKGDDYHAEEVVNSAVKKKIKEIKNDSQIPTEQKQQAISYYVRLGKKLNMKKSFMELSKEFQPAAIKAQMAESRYNKPYEELNPTEKKEIDKDYKDDIKFEQGERLEMTVKSIEKGMQVTGNDFINLANAGANNGNQVPIAALIKTGLRQVDAEGMLDAANKVVNYSRLKFSNNNKRLESREGQAFMENYYNELKINGDIASLKTQIKEVEGADKVDLQKQIDLLEQTKKEIQDVNLELGRTEYERAAQEIAPKTMEAAEKAGIETFEGNTEQVKEFLDSFPEGTFVETQSGYFGVDSREYIINPTTKRSIKNPNKGKNLAIFNKDVISSSRNIGVEAHEIIGHTSQELVIGDAAVNKRAAAIRKKNPKMSAAKAKEQATTEALDYIEGVKNELKKKGTGAYEKVEQQMEQVGGYKEYKEKVEAGGPRDLKVEKEFLAEFVQLAEQGAFEGTKGIQKEIKESSTLEPSANPKSYVDFVLRGGTKVENIAEGTLKKTADKLNRLNKKYGTDVSLSKSNKIADNEVRLKGHQKKRNETIDKIEKEHATSKEAWDKWTEENPGEVLKMSYSFVPDLININKRKGVENPEDTASETAMTELFNTIKAFNPGVKKTEGSFSLAGYIGKKLDWRAGDNIKRTEKKTKTISENQEGVKTVMERQADKSVSTPETTEKATTKGVDPRRVMDTKTREAYNKSVKDKLLKEIVKVDKETGEKTIDLEKLDKLDYADNKIMSPKEAAEFFGISESTLAGKNPLDSKNTTKGDIKIKDGMRSEAGSEAYNLNKKLYDIAEEYSRLLNTTQLQPKDIVGGDIAELEAKYKKSGSERDRKALQKRKDMMRAQDSQRTGDQSKQGTSLNIDPSIVKKLYEKTDIRSMGKGSQPYVQTAKNFTAESFRKKAGIVNPKEFKGKNEAKTAADKKALRNQSTLNTALARNYIRMVEGKIQREALEELKQEVGDKEMQQNLDKAIRELYKGASKFSASNKVVDNFKGKNKYEPKVLNNFFKGFARKRIIGPPDIVRAAKNATDNKRVQAELITDYTRESKKAGEFTDKETIRLEEQRSAATEKQIIEDLKEQIKNEEGVDVTFKEAKDIYDQTEKNFKDVVSALKKAGLDVDYFPSIEKNILTEEHLPKMQEAVKVLLKDIDFESLPTNIQRAIQSSLTANTTLRFPDGTRANPKKVTGKGATEKGYKGAGNYLEKLFEVPGLAKGNKAKTEKFIEKVKYAKLPEPGAFKKSSAKINREVDYKTDPTEWMNRHYELLIGKDLLAKVKKGEMTHQEAYELTSKHNTSLKDWYFSRVDKMNPNAALVIERLQTNSSTGIPRGATSYESISTRLEKDPRKEGTKEENVESHNEHVKERLNESKEFFATYADKGLSQAQKNLNYKKMTRTGGQYLIDKRLQGDKDATGKTIRISSSDRANTLVIPERAFDQVIMKGKDAGKTIGEVALRDMGKKRALEVLSKMKPSVETVEAKQAIEFASEKAKVKEQNIEVAKEAGMLASNKISPEKTREELKVRDKAIRLANKINKPVKKARVFDFDDTVARTNSKVFATRDGKRKVLTAEEFAKQGEKLVSEGWKMDFSDFNKVVEGKKGPLFDLMKKMKEAAGERDLFILTARAPEAAPAIKQFLDAMGIKIPLENITGLGNSTGKAKADWLVEKASKGYNDFYFADDAVQNVKAVRDALEVLDVKSQVQQARMNASNKLSQEFNQIIEEKTGIGAEKIFSDVKAEIRGAKARRQRFFIPPSAEDFLGLLYATLPKGAKGNKALNFYKKNLLDPYTRAMENLSTDRVNMMNDFKQLKKELDVPKDLKKTTESGFTNEQAVRVSIFNKLGHEIPGLSKTDLKELNEIVKNNPKLEAFADQILQITKGDGYIKPGKEWQTGNITTDLIELLNTTKRGKYLEQWKENVDVIFSKENMNKLEAAYGKKYREAMENMLARMKSGSNRTAGGNRLSNQVLDYINNSTGVTMFVNTRSALLQTISAANFVNWSFNNPLRAGKAFANQPQYWKDFVKLMNSDYLVDRRNGLKLNINESEIANAAKTSKNKAKAALNYMLEKGYILTKTADSFAIASGGATFYRNRINDLIKQGKTKAEAEKQAMEEFRATSERSQQSSDPSKISQQQSGDLGRIILQYANTPMQYARLQKRAVQDIANGRGDMKENLSKVIYYGFVQNLMFNALQQGAFALGFGDDFTEDDVDRKTLDTANGMLDSSLRGLGLGGVTLQVLKNLGLDIYKRSQRKRPEYSDAYYKLLEFSPAIKSKLSRFKGAAYPFDSKKRRKEVFDKGFSLDNPAYESLAKVVTAVTNAPVDRIFTKANNLKNATADDTEMWMSIANVLGWPTWQLEPKKSNNVKSTPKVLTKEDKINKAKSKIDKMSYLQLKQAMRSKGKNYTGKTSDELRKELKLLTK